MRWIGFGLALLLAIGAAFWLRRRAPRPPAPEVAPLLLIAGEQRGELRPCGCAKPQLGGIEQREALIGRLAPAGRRVVIEIGNAVARTGAQARLKYGRFCQAARALGAPAMTIGDRDLLLGLETLRAAAGDLPLLAANLLTAGGEPALERSVSIPAPSVGGQPSAPIRLVGLLPGDARPPSGLVVTPPGEALAALLPELPAGERLLVVGCFRREAARALAAQLEAAGRGALVIYSTGSSSPPPRGERVGRVRLAGLGGKSRYLLASPLAASGWGPTAMVDVQAETDGPLAATALVAGYRADVRAQGLLGKHPRLPLAEGQAFVGSKRCWDCHPKAHEIWLETRHANAMKSLRDSGDDRDPECVSCHVVGLDRVGGHASPQAVPGLDRVGCESCHGPGGRHAASPSRDNIELGGAATCKGCHDKSHDPTFEMKKKWPKIAH